MMAPAKGYNTASDPSSTGQPETLALQTFNASILVVEDHEDIRFLLRTLLEMHGASVVEADNGEMAIALVKDVHLDLILMDGSLPLLDGFEATRRIREFISTSEVPIVFLSGHAEPAAEAKAFAAGCTDYLVKPFALGDLDRVLKRHLSQSTVH